MTYSDEFTSRILSGESSTCIAHAAPCVAAASCFTFTTRGALWLKSASITLNSQGPAYRDRDTFLPDFLDGECFERAGGSTIAICIFVRTTILMMLAHEICREGVHNVTDESQTNRSYLTRCLQFRVTEIEGRMDLNPFAIISPSG